MFMTVADDLCKIPANIDVIMTIKKTAKVIPTSKAANLPLSFTNSLYAIFRIPLTAGLLFNTLLFSCQAFALIIFLEGYLT